MLKELYVRNVFQIIRKWPWYVTRHYEIMSI